jgi:hypothetical protein
METNSLFSWSKSSIIFNIQFKMSPVYIVSYFYEIHFNIILICRPGSWNWRLSIIYNTKFKYGISSLQCLQKSLPILILADLIIPKTLIKYGESRKVSLIKFPHPYVTSFLYFIPLVSKHFLQGFLSNPLRLYFVFCILYFVPNVGRHVSYKPTDKNHSFVYSNFEIYTKYLNKLGFSLLRQGNSSLRFH